MTSTTVSLIAFACIFGGALIGVLLRAILPEHHFTNEAKDVFRLGLGLITTLTALVLGLLVSTAKSSYDAERSQITQIAADAILVDRSLALYGQDAEATRRALHDLITGFADQIESLRARTAPAPSTNGTLPMKSGAEDFYKMVRKLSPRDDAQRSLKAEALRISLEAAKIQASALASEGSSIPMPFLVVLVLWLTILFAGFGLFAPRNLTVIAALCLCAMIVSTAIFLILDMDQPLTGFMELSGEPLRNAIAVIGR